MVWAIRQGTLNRQLAWLLAHQVGRAVRIGDAAADGFVIGGPAGSADEAILALPTPAAPMLDLGTGSPRSARLNLVFEAGTISHYSGFGPGAAVSKESLQGWTICFDVDLNLGQIAHEALGTATHAIPPSVAAILANYDASMFRIESIFLDLDNADLTRYDEAHSTIPTQDAFVRRNFGKGMGAWLAGFRGKANPFILGYPVSRLAAAPEPRAMFDPTGVSLSCSAARPAPGATAPAGEPTLNFLLLTGGKKVEDDPAYYAAGAGELHANPVAGTEGEGVAIVSRELFFNVYLRRTLAQPLLAQLLDLGDYRHARDDCGPDLAIDERTGGFQATDAGWHYEEHVKLAWKEGGGDLRHERESERRIACDLTLGMQPDGAGVARPTVSVTLSQMRYEWDQTDEDFGAAGAGYLGKGWARATMASHLALSYRLNDRGGFDIDSAFHADPAVTESGKDGVYKVTDLFAGLLGLGTISDAWSRQAAQLADTGAGVASVLATATGPLLDAARLAIVMPATSVFRYGGMRLNAQGDVEFALRYGDAVAGQASPGAGAAASSA